MNLENSSLNYGNNLILNIKASPILCLVCGILHGGALLPVFLLDLPWWVSTLLVMAIAVSLWHVLVQHGLRYGRCAVTALRFAEAGTTLAVRIGARDWRAAKVVSRFVHPLLVLLRVRVDGRRLAVSLVLPIDAIEVDGFRRLRIALTAPARNPAE